jgi:hypothetical protein
MTHITDITDHVMRTKLIQDLELHITVWREFSDESEIKSLRGAISYYSTPSEDKEYENKFQTMLAIHGIVL